MRALKPQGEPAHSAHPSRQAAVPWGLVGLLAALMCVAYLDRVNIGFAALTMNAALGLTPAQFGFAAGIFAVGYAAAGLPSTWALQRFGARRVLAAGALAWGLTAASTAFVHSALGLDILRGLLGVAEAGLAPGTVLVMNAHLPAHLRGRLFGVYFSILPVSQLIAGPLSGVLLSVHALGLAGWQWVFLAEGLPSVALAAGVLRGLPAAPPAAEAACERADGPSEGTFWQGLRGAPVWALSGLCALQSTAGIGVLLFLPLLTRSMGFTVTMSALTATIPAACAAALLPLWGLWSDKARHRGSVAAAANLAVAAGLAGAALLLPSPWALVPLSVALTAFFGSLAPFWTLPAQGGAGAAAAAGIALVTLCGNLGQLAGPWLLGALSPRPGDYGAGLGVLAGIAALAAAGLAAFTAWTARVRAAALTVTR